ncbi:DNA alkylation repair protein [Desulfonema magnum]|uniref:DNA alkylation repair protein n=1 Tax=Desulfonema magnum TaxID=45655 RepID=A0A975GS54_9BACT|nr:DNA alkylation repair protein [Desulfonema magnum]QTA91695.1 DNA alkylation repair protein [Desulfonema magnum]
MRYDNILERLKSLADPESVAGMARFGVNSENTYGISIPNLRKIAAQIGKDHLLAAHLWSSGIHEARILACMTDAPQMVTRDQMERQVKDFDSWDICDQCCNKLFVKTEFAYLKAIEWTTREEEFVKRAGFVLMTQVAVHDKHADELQFEQFFSMIIREAWDARNFVKKAVNWALRQIGKRNQYLNTRAIEIAEDIRKTDSKAARWIATDALRELTGDNVQKRLRKNKVGEAILNPGDCLQGALLLWSIFL